MKRKDQKLNNAEMHENPTKITVEFRFPKPKSLLGFTKKIVIRKVTEYIPDEIVLEKIEDDIEKFK